MGGEDGWISHLGCSGYRDLLLSAAPSHSVRRLICGVFLQSQVSSILFAIGGWLQFVLIGMSLVEPIA